MSDTEKGIPSGVPPVVGRGSRGPCRCVSMSDPVRRIPSEGSRARVRVGVSACQIPRGGSRAGVPSRDTCQHVESRVGIRDQAILFLLDASLGAIYAQRSTGQSQEGDHIHVTVLVQGSVSI